MNDDQHSEWREMRAEQTALRAQLERLEQRLARFEAGEVAVSLPVAAPPPVLPPRPDTPPPLPPVPAAASAGRPSMEARIGADWLVRVGVVLLLTSLAFLGDYLYRNIVPHLGPASKVGLLYLGAGTLAGLGAWLERSRAGREIPKVRNYARVVLAGGLAAVYYVTYAAHYYPALRVIGSPFVAGALLMGWSAFMAWLADRRGSETLATFAILLAFYTSAINEVAGFTLAANLPLAIAAVFLLRRHLWKIFPFASLLATFGSYGYWRYFHVYAAWRGLPGHGTLDPGGFRVEAAFLLLYWALFTWAVFSSPETTLPSRQRAGFASLNNGAFFLLLTWSVLKDYPDSFWKWSLGFGVVLLSLAEIGRRLGRRLDEQTEGAYLLQGVMLVTLGFVTYLSGWQLSLVLAVQSVVLLAAADQRQNRLLLAASVASAAMAFVLTLQQLYLPGEGYFQVLGPSVGAMLAFNAWRSRRLTATAAGLYEAMTLGLALAWGEQFFPYEARFSLFALAGALVFALGIETRQKRLPLWSYVLTGAGLAAFWLDYGPYEHRQPIQWLGLGCLVAQQRFGRRRPGPADAAMFPPAAQTALMTAAMLTGWVAWTSAIEHWFGGGFTLAAGWSVYAVGVFALGLALHERVYRWLGLLVLVGTLAHVALVDIWQLNSLERFFSLLSLGVVLLALGFFYTRYQSKLKDLF